MVSNPKITTLDISNKLKTDRKNVEANIRALKKLGVIDRIGARKNGEWVVKI
jgi:predicted HTH transcriptional regulator